MATSAPDLSAAVLERSKPTLWDYAAVIRPASAIKHLFVIPGIALALILRPDARGFSLDILILAFASVFCGASANYVINEWLDRDFDRHHPDKSGRPCVTKDMSPAAIYAEFAVLGLAALALGGAASALTGMCAAALLLNGIFYNVLPFRAKNAAILDVLCESFNNAVRLVFGWSIVDPHTLPPGSVLFAYWMGGAFLMAVKRLAEYREFAAAGQIADLVRYRASFGSYSDRSLTVSAFAYAQLTTFGLAVFIVKYRIEYLLAAPLICLMFCLYLWAGLRASRGAQRPDDLFKERWVIAVVAAVVIALGILTFVDVPAIAPLVNAHYIALPPQL